MLSFDEIIYQAIWLRVRLHDFETDNTYRTLAKKNKKFRTEITGLFLTPEHEKLFASYKKHKPFEAAFSLRSLLYGEEIENVFYTYV